MLAGPEIARAVNEFEETYWDVQCLPGHHEDINTVQISFANEVKALVAVVEEFGNPFTETTTELLTLDTKQIMDSAVVKAMQSAKNTGRVQYEGYLSERIAGSKRPVTDIIKKNNLSLFQKLPEKHSKSKLQTSALKKDRQLFSRLYIACQSRDGDLEQFFAHKNQAEPPSLSSEGSL